MSNAEHTNRLIHESSPYLLQHAHNPVDWYPWGEEAWARAREEDKLVIISIGYSACHWCHVMERESFENEQVAALMNKNYICIKVDREERPDVDAFFMDACQLMTQRGGWPLNAFALPDGRPVYAGTYFPRNSWLGLLHEIAGGYKRKKDQYHQYAEKLMDGIRQMSLIETPDEERESKLANEEVLRQAFFNLSSQFDKEEGGRGVAPKFPMPVIWRFLLRYSLYSGEEYARQFALFTLDKIHAGGIYDHLGGGFARYSVDGEWHVPHFEKMLYDNAQLISLYSEAYQLTADERYKNVVLETVNWLIREMRHPEGGFFSALDADSEGVEGKFYVWTEDELREVLNEEEFRLIQLHYGISEYSLWEDEQNVLRIQLTPEKAAAKVGLSVSETKEKLAAAKEKLFHVRNERIHPGLDDKILLSWNALTLEALADAYKAFGEEHLQNLLEQNLTFLRQKMAQGTQLWRTWKNDKKSIPAFLEDYALYISALLSCYEVLFEETLLDEAKALTDHVLKHYLDEKSGLFYFTSDENQELATRKIDSSDNVIPSPNSVMAHNLFRLGHLLGHTVYLGHAKKMLGTVLPNLANYSPFFANWASLLTSMSAPFYEVAVVGEDYLEKTEDLNRRFLPFKVMLASRTGESNLELLQGKGEPGKTLIYVCADRACQQPVEKVYEAVQEMQGTTAWGK